MAMLQMMKRRLRQVGDIPVVTELCFEVQCCCPYTSLPNWVPCLLSIQAKSNDCPKDLGPFRGYPVRLRLSPHDFPKASVNELLLEWRTCSAQFTKPSFLLILFLITGVFFSPRIKTLRAYL